ncbi:MAG: bifunctional phosphoglucose/phosphomannose isomerase [Chloroflexi bacterium]|nr:bifunctional phosphoglucose/phosphomannose isomerase [Chloroflexota bacterium]
MSDQRHIPGGILDDGDALRRLDRSDMLGAAARVPDQVRDAWRISRSLTLPAEHRAATAVAVLGMGGSAIGGDLVRGIWADRLRVPVEVVRGYDLPAWVGEGTLVVASSYSGGTEETISAFGEAAARRARTVVLSTGGTLLDVARRAGLPNLTFPGGGQPRASVGYALTLLAGVLERAGMLDVSDAEVEAAAAVADARVAASAPGVPTADNEAKRLAWTLVDRLPIIEASGFLAPVARRWKTQLNENSKSTAAWEELPEATHNTVVGYPQPDTLRDHLLVVFLEGGSEHPRDLLRARLSRELLDSAGIEHHVAQLAGTDRLSQALDGIVRGDFASIYLAALYGEDPTPVEVLVQLKQVMALSDGDDTDDEDVSADT